MRFVIDLFIAACAAIGVFWLLSSLNAWPPLTLIMVVVMFTAVILRMENK